MLNYRKYHHHHYPSALIASLHLTSLGLGFVTITANLDTTEAIGFTLRSTVHLRARSASLEIILEPSKHELTKTAVTGVGNGAVNGGEHVVSSVPLLNGTKVHVHEVRGPAGKVVENVSSVHNGALAKLGLLLEPAEEAGTAEDVKINGDFVEEQDSPRADETHGKLHSASLTVGYGMHAPVGVDIKHLHELISALRVCISTNRGKQIVYTNVVANNGVQNPLQTKICHTLETLLEGIYSADRDGIAGSQTLAGKQTKQGSLSGSIGPNEKSAGAWGQINGDVVNTSRVVRKGV